MGKSCLFSFLILSVTTIFSLKAAPESDNILKKKAETSQLRRFFRAQNPPQVPKKILAPKRYIPRREKENKLGGVSTKISKINKSYFTQDEREEISSTKISYIPPTGKLTEHAVKEWILKEKILNPKVANQACLFVEKLKTEEERTGKSLTADQVFLIYTACNLKEKEHKKLVFVLKLFNDKKSRSPEDIPDSIKEIKNLLKLKKDFKGLNSEKGFPKIIFPEFFYTYEVSKQDQKERFFSLIHAAKGESLKKLFDDFSDWIITHEKNMEKMRSKGVKGTALANATIESQRKSLLTAAKALGNGMALMHTRFLNGKECDVFNEKGNLSKCKTQLHGDLHPQNIFWDGKTISLIDIESMARKQSDYGALPELSQFYAYLYSMVGSEYTMEIPDYKKTFEKFWEAFFKAYITTYRLKTNTAHTNKFLEAFKKTWHFVGISMRVFDSYLYPQRSKMAPELIKKSVRPKA